MYTKFDVLETIDMVAKEHLDIRTFTMGISLFPCVRGSAEETARAVYDLVCSRAENIVGTAEALSGEYGIPIVNKRVSVTPVSLISSAFPEKAPLIARALDRAAEELGIDFLGGYSALFVLFHIHLFLLHLEISFLFLLYLCKHFLLFYLLYRLS